MIIAHRNGMVSKSGWVNPYVTDGLVAMWDGIWNVGGGVHDPAATVWKDLVGNLDYDLNGATVSGDNIAWDKKVSLCSSPPPNFIQMEITFKSMDQWNWAIWFGDYWHSVMSYFGAFLESKTARSDNSSYKFSAKAVSIPIVTPVDGGRGANEIYEYGERKVIKGNFNGVMPDRAANTMSIGSSNTGGLALHGIRLYNRHLTAAEIAANDAVDKERFGLP